MPYDHAIFFDYVRDSLFSGSMNQAQVDGMEAILTAWETHLDGQNPKWLAYMFATTYHETAQEMQPIEEYGKGSGQPYGEIDSTTGCAYYGRGFVQLTWKDNYIRADTEGGWEDAESCEWHAENALDPHKAARIMWFGMSEGWFRSDSKGKQTLERYFSEVADDAYGAREIINGDKSKIPDWSNGVSIGNLVKGYHRNFLTALEAAHQSTEPSPEPSPIPSEPVSVAITAPKGVQVVVTVDEKEV